MATVTPLDEGEGKCRGNWRGNRQQFYQFKQLAVLIMVKLSYFCNFLTMYANIWLHVHVARAPTSTRDPCKWRAQKLRLINFEVNLPQFTGSKNNCTHPCPCAMTMHENYPESSTNSASEFWMLYSLSIHIFISLYSTSCLFVYN